MTDYTAIWEKFIPAFAALIGAILGSTLSFMYGRSMEKYKQSIAFDIRRREIRYSKLPRQTPGDCGGSPRTVRQAPGDAGHPHRVHSEPEAEKPRRTYR